MVLYKKAFMADGNDVIVQLSANKKQVEPLAHMPGAFIIKGKAKVIAILDMWGFGTSFEVAHSHHDRTFSYPVGKEVQGKNGIWCWGNFRNAIAYWLGDEGNKDPRYIELANGKENK